MIDISTLLAILAMGCATYFTRVLGVFLAPRIVLTGATKAAMDAVPPAILMAIIAPTVLATGVAETLAAVITLIVARRMPLPVAIIAGVISVVALRQVF